MTSTETTTQVSTVFDETQTQFARVYSNALVNAAVKAGVLQLVVDEVDEIARLFAGNPAFLSAFLDRTEKAEQTDKLILKAFSGQVHELVLNLLRVLNEKSRLGIIHALADRLKSDSDSLLGRCRVHVKVARQLDSAAQGKLVNQLQDRLGLVPQIQYSIDPSLIGGLVIRIGDLQFDSSIRSRLEQLRKNLLEGKIHEIQSRRDQLHTSA